MAKETFYQALESGNYTKESFEKLCFTREQSGPRYQVVFTNPEAGMKESINEGHYNLRTITPSLSVITDEKAKKSILSRLYHNGRKS
ncbi:MAG: hypothetical protein NTZ83_05040 [Candidatus Pacearchaeota archaeon]|nr:hypothetical protein [Candidatus Pacearchaeota archaeon]